MPTRQRDTTRNPRSALQTASPSPHPGPAGGGISPTPNRRTRSNPSERDRQIAYSVYTHTEQLPRGDVRKVQDDFDNAGVPIWNVFDFRQITRESKVVKDLARL